MQAAEADSAIWSSGSVSMTFAVGTDDTWKDKVFASNDAKLEDAARIENAEVGEKVKLTAKITLDGDVSSLDGAETEEGSDAYNALQLSAAIKSGDSWTYAKAGNYPFLKAENFTDGVAEVEFTIDVDKADVGVLQEIIFQYNVNGYEGNIVVSDVSIVDGGEAPVTKEEDVWSGDDVSLTFAVGTDDTWKDKVFASNDAKLEDAARIENAEVGEKVKLTAKITLDGDVSNLDGAETEEGSDAYNALQLSAAIKSGDSWKYAKAGNYPFLKEEDFTDGVAEVEFTIDVDKADVGVLQEVIFQYNVNGYEGNIVVSDVKIVNVIEIGNDEPLPEKEPTIVADFETGIDGWEPESGYVYHGGDPDATKANKKTTIAWDENAEALKVHVDYSLDSASNWSEAKVKFWSEEGLDVSAYNLISYDMIYPAALDGKVKTKVYASNVDKDTPIINKDVSITSEDYAEGLKKATVTIRFSPSTDKINNLTLSIVGSKTDFVGDVLLDNVTLSQYDASADFVDIAEEVQAAGDKAILTGMPEEVSLADVDASAETKALYAYLQGLIAADQVLFGHQNDTHKCVGTGEGVYSDTKDITGSISGLVGIDSLALTGAELGLDDVDEAIERAVEIGKAAAAEGAILTLSTHMPNMSNAKIKATPDAERPYDFNACDFNESKDLTNNCAQEVMPGGKYNAQFTAYLDIIADYALGLGDIPVLFRPFHENTGGWFWWGSATTDKETYRAMFRYTKDYLSSRGVHNFIYVYSPNGPLTSEAGYLDRYPGDDCVDVLGFDYYDDYNNYPASYSPAFMTNLAKSCEVVSSLAKKKGKVAAISETGVRAMKADKSDNEGILVKGNPIKDQEWYGKVNNVAKENGIPYFLLWANFSDTNFYVPYKYNDTKGHELINEFIKFYNEDSSIFANGTNFYDEAAKKAVTNTNTLETEKATGYFVNMFSKMIITEPMTIKASVKNAKGSVKFVLKNGEKTETITAIKDTETGYYVGDVTAEILTALGQTDIGTAALLVDDEELVSLSFISFGKEKDVLPKNIIENFELYYGDDDYLAGAFSETSYAGGAGSSMILDETNKASGSYGGAFTYTFNTEGAEVYTGQQKSLDEADYTGYNALKLWIKPDGKQQKFVLQLVSNEEDFEVYPNTFFKESTDATYLTIPFASFKGKAGGDIDPANITKFAVWCNSIGAQELESSIYMDDIQFVALTSEELKNVNEQGFIVGNQSDTDSAVEKVIEAINAIKDVKYDAASKKAIEDARKAYNALTDAQKELVSADTLKKLEAAEKSYADQKKAAEDAAAKATEADKKAAADVTAAIEAIKDVQYNDASKAAIEAARKAYDALTADQKKLISADTLKKLTDAEAAYAQKKAEAENPVKTPVLEAAKNATNAITVKWTATEGAAGYNVYVAVKKTYVKVGSTSSTSYKINKVNKKKLKAATAYQVKVVAYDKDNKEIAGSELELATATSPAKVKISSLSRKSSTKATLKWKKVTGASGYEVYMKTGSGKYKLVKTIKKGKTVSFTKSKLKKGKKYTFKVRAYKTAGGKKVYGAYSKTKSIK